MDDAYANGDLDPDLVKQIMALQDPETDPDMMKLNRQAKMVDRLRGQGPLQGQMVSGHYVAPSALAQIANLGTQAMGMMADNKIDKGMADYGAKRTSARTAYMNALSQNLRKPRINSPAKTPIGAATPDANMDSAYASYFGLE